MYLVEQTARVSCTHDPEEALTHLTVRGRWDGEARTQTARALRGCVAETPRAVLADLSGLDDGAGDSAPTWQVASRFALESSTPTRVIVCAAPPPVRSRLTAATAVYPVALADTVADARYLLGPFTGWNHRFYRLRLPPELGAVFAARTLAAEACLNYRLPHLIHHARLIISELATNAVEHSGSDFEVQVSVRGPVLHLAVQDRHPRPPRLIEAGPPGMPTLGPGYGLRVVAAAATSWGSLPCPEGKVVWATLALEGSPAR